MVAIARIMMSQKPFHRPVNEPLPKFTDQWFERYDRGDDIAHWYRTSATG